jgi:membrane-bound lytic murein transglycosylase A
MIRQAHRPPRLVASTVLACVLSTAAVAGAQPLPPAECVRALAGDVDPAQVREALSRNLKAPALDRPAARPVRQATITALDALAGAAGLERLCAALVMERAADAALLTGYYRPVVPARPSRDGEFRHPLYALPDSSLRGLSRARIDGGALDGRVPVVAWLADPIESFFIHVQGSALLAMPDGQIAVGYAGSNDRPYTSIGALLVRDGKMRLEDVTMASLKAYLRDHPSERDAILHANERFIYFRRLDSPPVGSLGVELTAVRSVAADPGVYPPGTLLFLRPVDAAGPVDARLVVVQDQGSAIVGPRRLDLFTGSGEEAGAVAGALRQTVEIFVLRPK